MKPFKVANFRTEEPRALQLAARELGHGIQTRTLAELASIRGELSAISGLEGSYARGFHDAIEHVLAGLSAEAKHHTAINEDVAATKVRKNAVKVLLALHAGDEIPKDIVKRTKLTAPAVSIELAELEREDLVERLEPGAGQDQRMVPRVLGIRGKQLAQALSKETVSPTAQAASDLAPVFVAFFNTLSDQRLTRHRLQAIAVERFGKVSGEFVCDEFLRHAEDQRIVSGTDSMIRLTSLHLGLRLSDVLQTAISSANVPVLDQLKQLASSADVCVRVTSRMRDRWQVALAKREIRNIHTWCFDDALVEQLPKPRGAYHIVWENPGVLSRDLADLNIQSFINDAKQRYCYATPGMRLPADVERLDLDAHHVGK